MKTANGYSIVVLKSKRVLAQGLSLTEAKERCREWNRKATLANWAVLEPAPPASPYAELLARREGVSR